MAWRRPRRAIRQSVNNGPAVTSRSGTQHVSLWLLQASSSNRSSDSHKYSETLAPFISEDPAIASILEAGIELCRISHSFPRASAGAAVLA